MYRLHIVTWDRDEYRTLNCDEQEAIKRYYRTVKHLCDMGTQITLYKSGQLTPIASYKERG